MGAKRFDFFFDEGHLSRALRERIVEVRARQLGECRALPLFGGVRRPADTTGMAHCLFTKKVFCSHREGALL